MISASFFFKPRPGGGRAGEDDYVSCLIMPSAASERILKSRPLREHVPTGTDLLSGVHYYYASYQSEYDSNGRYRVTIPRV